MKRDRAQSEENKGDQRPISQIYEDASTKQKKGTTAHKIVSLTFNLPISVRQLTPTPPKT